MNGKLARFLRAEARKMAWTHDPKKQVMRMRRRNSAGHGVEAEIMWAPGTYRRTYKILKAQAKKLHRSGVTNLRFGRVSTA